MNLFVAKARFCGARNVSCRQDSEVVLPSPCSPVDWCIATGARIFNESLCLRHYMEPSINVSSQNIFVTGYCFVRVFASERTLSQEMDLDLDKAASRLKKEQKARIEKVCSFCLIPCTLESIAPQTRRICQRMVSFLVTHKANGASLTTTARQT